MTPSKPYAVVVMTRRPPPKYERCETENDAVTCCSDKRVALSDDEPGSHTGLLGGSFSLSTAGDLLSRCCPP